MITLSTFLFSAMSAGVKYATQTLPNAEVVFFRNFVGLLTLTPLVVRSGKKAFVTQAFRFHLVRAVAGLSAMYCFFFALSKLRLADVVVLTYTMPLFMPVFAHLWLKEKFTPHLGGAWRWAFWGFSWC